jgi:filamentous hemagglutinin
MSSPITGLQASTEDRVLAGAQAILGAIGLGAGLYSSWKGVEGAQGVASKNVNATGALTDAEAGALVERGQGDAKATTNAPNTPRLITDSAGNTIDLDYTKGLRETTVTVTGTRGGVQYPLQGQPPDSYANLGNGHVVVYGPEGRALYDVSSSRIKVVEWNQAPNGTYFPKKGSDTKVFEGNVPQSILNSLGLK